MRELSFEDKISARAIIVALTILVSASISVLLLDEAIAGTTVIGDITIDMIWSPAGSPYWIESNVTVLPGVDLVILAGTEVKFNGSYFLRVNGRILVEGDAVNPIIFTHNGSSPSAGDWIGLEIYGEAHIDYANISYAQTGTYIASSLNTINESIFYGNERAISVHSASGNEIRNNTISNSTLRGIVLQESNGNVVSGNNVSWSGDIGIRLRNASDEFIVHNTLYRNYWYGTSIEENSMLNTISNNTILETTVYHGIRIRNSHDNEIVGNVMRRNTRTGIHLESSNGNRISHNEISYSVLTHGIYLDLANSNYISGNDIEYNEGYGIRIGYSLNNEIYANDISHNNHGGVYLFASGNVTVSSNNISSNSGGVGAVNSNYTRIVDNDILDSTFTGVYVHNSDQVMISGNEILSSGFHGIYLIGAEDFIIRENNVSSSGQYGIRLTVSRNVSIYHNNFVNNSVQAYDDRGAENRWDDGYPSGGNYWSDYAGPDFFSGPDQDQPGCDHIGDMPYEIDLDSQDRYPRLYPSGIAPARPPTNISAHLSGKQFENVTIEWTLSEDDGGGERTAIGYDIYRGSVFDSNGTDYALLTKLPNGTSVYVDNFSGEGDSSCYFYRICAVNVLGFLSCGANQAGKFTRFLTEGPNLISIPLLQKNESIKNVLQTLEFDKAWSYDSFEEEWKWHMTFKDYRRELWNINHTMGLWVNVTRESNLTVAGIVPAQTVIYLGEGWNLASFPSFGALYTISDLKAEIGATRVEGYESVSPYYLRVLGDAETLQAGYGYWVRVETDTVWIVEVS